MSLYTYYDDPEPLILEPNQHYSTPHNRPNSTPPTETIQTQPNPPYRTHHPPHTTHPPHPPHLPPRRYYAPLPSPPDHHHHHHPTHLAYPTYHPEGTMHLCLRPLTTTTTTTQPTPPTPPTTQKVLCTFAFAPRPPPPPPPNPPRLPHLPPRRYYAPLPSPPDHHHHHLHHPTHPAHPTYHPEGTMHLCLRPPTTTTTTTHHHTTQQPTTTPPNHPPTHPFGTSACFITDVFVVLLKIPFTGIELTSQRVIRGYTSELPGRPVVQSSSRVVIIYCFERKTLVKNSYY